VSRRASSWKPLLSWIRRHLELTPVGHAYSPNWPELGCRSLLDHPGIGGDLLTIGLRSP